MHKAHRRVVRKRLIILAVLAALAATAALVLSRYERYHTFTDYQTVWERDLVAEAQEAAARGKEASAGTEILGTEFSNIQRTGLPIWTPRARWYGYRAMK